MAVTKARKIEQVEELSKELQNAQAWHRRHLCQADRREGFRASQGGARRGRQYRVLKNTLAERAAKGTAVEEAVKSLAGVTSLAYTSGDPVALAKALSKYAKDNPEYTFKAGIVEGRVIAIKDIDALANMPSKEEIYSKLLFLMTAPAQRLVTVMNAVGRDIAVVINQGVEKNKFAGGRGGSRTRGCRQKPRQQKQLRQPKQLRPKRRPRRFWVELAFRPALRADV